MEKTVDFGIGFMPKPLIHKARDFIAFRFYDGLAWLLPDWTWCNHFLSHLHFFRRHGYFANPSLNRDMNDYLFALKLNPEIAKYGHLVDKEQVKNFITDQIGPRIVVPTLAVYRHVNELSAYQLSRPYIVKPTHMCGQVIFKEGGALTQQELRQCQKWLKTNFFKVTREYGYRYLEPKIIIEPLLTYQGERAPDLKFSMWNGKCGFIQYDQGRFVELRRNLYTPEWKQIPARLTVPNIDAVIPRPQGFEEMHAIAKKIAALFKEFVRVDFFLTDEGFKFAEITLTPGNAGESFIPFEVGQALWQNMTAPSSRRKAPVIALPTPADTVLQYS